MKVKLFQKYDALKPYSLDKIDKNINLSLQIFDDFFDFENLGFYYERDSSSKSSSNKAVEENSIAIWLLLDLIKNSNNRLNKDHLLQTLDVIYKKWNKKKGIVNTFSVNWEELDEVVEVAKLHDLALAVLKACEITNKKHYIDWLIEITAVIKLRKKPKSEIFFNKKSEISLNEESKGIISWVSIKHLLFLNELYDFFNNKKNRGKYNPKLSLSLFNKEITTFSGFLSHIRKSKADFITDYEKYLGNKQYGFLRGIDKYGDLVKEVKLYGNSIVGIAIINSFHDAGRDDTRNFEDYLNIILTLVNKLWDEKNGGHFRNIDIKDNIPFIDTNKKNIISNITVAIFLIEYVSFKLDDIDLKEIKDVGTDLMQALHQLDVTVNKLISLNKIGIRDVSNDWKTVQVSKQLHPVYTFIKLLHKYKSMNEDYQSELQVIRELLNLRLQNRIFFSYSGDDANLVSEINTKIEDLGYKTFFDNEIEKQGNGKIPKILENGMRESSLAVFFVTENFSEKREYLEFEINEALKQKALKKNYFRIIILLIGKNAIKPTIFKEEEEYSFHINNKNDYLDMYHKILKNIPDFMKIV